MATSSAWKDLLLKKKKVIKQQENIFTKILIRIHYIIKYIKDINYYNKIFFIKKNNQTNIITFFF